jgi:ATP-dependent helicase HrpB
MLPAAFPDRVCRRRRAGEDDAVMVGGRGAKLARESGVKDATLFLALVVDGGDARASKVRVAEAIDENLLRAVLPTHVVTADAARYDDERNSMIGVRRTTYLDLVLDERVGVAVPLDVQSAGLAAALAERFSSWFRLDDDATALRQRIRFAQKRMPELPWPALGDDDIALWLPELCMGKRTLDDVKKLNWSSAILERMPWELKRVLDEEVPARLEVPSGSFIAVDYTSALDDGGAPTLAVRLQELFGLEETPTVARGRVPVVLQLLSPGYKPVQVTRDLRSFWRGAYVEVKKELRARYPKHSWPDDPLTAPPTARARRRPT